MMILLFITGVLVVVAMPFESILLEAAASAYALHGQEVRGTRLIAITAVLLLG